MTGPQTWVTDPEPDAPSIPNHPCAACGQLDDHPMIHVAYAIWERDDKTLIREPSFHFDCLPAEFRSDLVGPQHTVTVMAIEAAESGTHGDELRSAIQSLPSDNEVEPEVTEA